MLTGGSLRFVRGEEGEEDKVMKEGAEVSFYPAQPGVAPLPTLAQVVERRGGSAAVWVGPEGLEAGFEKGCVYVLDSFSSPHYKALIKLGKCR